MPIVLLAAAPCLAVPLARGQTPSRQVTTITIPATYVTVFAGTSAWHEATRSRLDTLTDRGKPMVSEAHLASLLVTVTIDSLGQTAAAVVVGVSAEEGDFVQATLVLRLTPEELAEAVMSAVEGMIASAPQSLGDRGSRNRGHAPTP